MEKIKKILKKNKLIKNSYIKLNVLYYSFLTVVSPVLNTKVRYKKSFGVKLNLTNPKTFNEKLIWLKLNNYIKNPLVWKCSDKVQVKTYLLDKDMSEIVIPTIGIYDKCSEIKWKELPAQFVVKMNFGAGMNIVCDNKDQLDEGSIKKQLNTWIKSKYWLPYSEMQYSKYPKKIIIEKYLKPEEGLLPQDYKVYCFNGKPKFILSMIDRGRDIKAIFKNFEWDTVDTIDKYKDLNFEINKPSCLNQMFEISAELSKDFPFVRVDFYVVNDKLYFGEMTFTPAGCLSVAQTKSIDMGSLLKLNL